eukprot:SAG25_NODE_288_length_10343_cov_3.673858_13_plen_94_part_00
MTCGDLPYCLCLHVSVCHVLCCLVLTLCAIRACANAIGHGVYILQLVESSRAPQAGGVHLGLAATLLLSCPFVLVLTTFCIVGSLEPISGLGR